MKDNNIANKLLSDFYKMYGEDDGEAVVYFAPSRINLIGEHTDYNGGFVLPFALPIGTYLVVRKRKDRIINFLSENFENDGVISSSLDNLKYEKTDEWSRYPAAVTQSIIESGQDLDCGFDMMFYGDIPIASGLSSSASIEVVTAFMYNDMFGLNFDGKKIAELCQKAEHKTGVNCGILDQWAIANGSKGNALYLDTTNKTHVSIPCDFGEYKIVVMNTNKPRSLMKSSYNERVAECQKALNCLRVQKPELDNLCSLSISEFEEMQHLIEDETIRRRARHVITENERTRMAKIALQNGNLTELGRLMYESHKSLRDDYEVAGNQLDSIVEAAMEQNNVLGADAVLGARMTGGGDGGCAIALVREDCIDEFITNVGASYSARTEDYNKKYNENGCEGYVADLFSATASDGPHRIECTTKCCEFTDANEESDATIVAKNSGIAKVLVP